MNDPQTRDLLRRLNEMERRAAKLRIGVVTSASPLEVTLGAADTAYTNCKTIATALTLGATVAVLICGNDLLVLGRIV